MATDNRVLVLRTVSADMTSRDRFRYPESGFVEAPDWDGGKDVCGGGLHGFLWGVGKGELADWSETAKWLVIAVDPADGLVELTVDGGGKCKFARGEVVYCGGRDGAIAYLDAHGAADKPVVGAARTAGDYGTATAGDYGAATAGCRGAATAGDYGTATTGYRGAATAGEGGTATAGDYGTATAGEGGTATAGDYGTATAGDYGTATAGEGGAIAWKVWDGQRWRLIVRYPGEDGIKAGTPYRWCKTKGKAVEVAKQELGDS